MARRPNDPQRRERNLQATLDTIPAHGIHTL
ncbi:TetR/AcrR family transcriptional regulator, partial [Klebsiella pneumoniae]